MMNASRSLNERLAAAIKAASKPSVKRQVRANGGRWTTETARAANLKRRVEHPVIPTATMRIHRDVIALAQSAWRDPATRIAETSEAIRERALRVFGGARLTASRGNSTAAPKPM